MLLLLTAKKPKIEVNTLLFRQQVVSATKSGACLCAAGGKRKLWVIRMSGSPRSPRQPSQKLITATKVEAQTTAAMYSALSEADRQFASEVKAAKKLLAAKARAEAAMEHASALSGRGAYGDDSWRMWAGAPSVSEEREMEDSLRRMVVWDAAARQNMRQHPPTSPLGSPRPARPPPTLEMFLGREMRPPPPRSPRSRAGSPRHLPLAQQHLPRHGLARYRAFGDYSYYVKQPETVHPPP